MREVKINFIISLIENIDRAAAGHLLPVWPQFDAVNVWGQLHNLTACPEHKVCVCMCVLGLGGCWQRASYCRCGAGCNQRREHTHTHPTTTEAALGIFFFSGSTLPHILVRLD